MPIVRVHLMQGRSAEQKKRLLTAISRAVEETLEAPRASIRVLIEEFAPDDYMVAGELASERRDGK